MGAHHRPHAEEGLPEGAQVPQGLDYDVQEAVVVASLVGEAPDQLQAGVVILQTLPGHASCLRNFPLVTCTASKRFILAGKVF